MKKQNTRSLYSAILIIIILLAVSLLLKGIEWVRGEKEKVENRDIDIRLEEIFTDWLKNTTGETITEFELLEKTYSTEIGMDTDPRYVYYDDVVKMYETVGSLLYASKERQRFELKKTQEFVETFEDKKRTSADSLYLGIMKTKQELLEQMLNDKVPDIEVLESVAVSQRDYVKDTNGWYVLAEITINDTIPARVTYAIDENNRFALLAYKEQE